MRAGSPWEFLEMPRPVGVDAVRVVHMVHPRMQQLHEQLDAALHGLCPPGPVIARQAAHICQEAGITDNAVCAALTDLIRPTGIHRLHRSGLQARQHGQTFAFYDCSGSILVDVDTCAVLIDARYAGPSIDFIGDVAACQRILALRLERMEAQARAGTRSQHAEHALLVTHPAWTEAGLQRLLYLMEAWANLPTDSTRDFLTCSIPVYRELVTDPRAQVTWINPGAVRMASHRQSLPPLSWL